jgi:sortase A
MTKKINFFLVVILIAGIGLLLYPSLSNWWNSFHQSKAIAGYIEAVSNMDKKEYERILEEAKQYNKNLKNASMWALSDSEKKAYDEQLNILGNGIMGYIEIPNINCSLPIYHGTSENVLQIATGHIEGSSLPVGGEGSHCVISGHRGLPSAKLFTNLDELAEGDYFHLCIFDEIFSYEVYQIRIVDPEDVTELTREAGEDLCTLVTCTPYGINSHRLLVRGHRVENISYSALKVSADASQISNLIVSAVICVPILFVCYVWLLIRHRKRR